MPTNYVLTPEGNFMDTAELYHYGVKGMKWGIRRYQNPDGSLTAAGKKKARQEYKADNKEAYELGRKATLEGHALVRSMDRTRKLGDKLAKRYDKNPDDNTKSTKKLREKWDASAVTTEELAKRYQESGRKAKEHCNSLIDKYGEEAVSSIKFRTLKTKDRDGQKVDVEVMNEKTSNFSDHALATGMTVTSAILSTLAGSPVTPIFYNKSTAQKAADVERALYTTNRKNKSKTFTPDPGVEIRTRVVANKDYEPGTVTNLDKAIKSKTPYYALSDSERNSIDRSYTDKRKSLIEKRNAASTQVEKDRLADEIDMLEMDYFDVVERDW